MNKDNLNSTILSEHRSVVVTRYILAIINFIAILAGTLLTLFLVGKRGVPDGVRIHLYILLAINILQVLLCMTDFITRKFFGVYLKWMPAVSYAVAGIWVLTLGGELVAGTMELGTLRVDLLAIAVIQLIVAVASYVLWPMLDRRAIDAMIRPSVREDLEKRRAKSKGFVIRYALLCFVIVFAQVGALFAYKMPPKLYDIFAPQRALKYTLNEDGSGYVVTSVYRGTSSSVNIPANYNNKPVVGLAKGALIDNDILEKYQVTEITFGTWTKDENGNEVLESNLQYIESGAIVNDKIETIELPYSVQIIGDSAIKSTSLKKVQYSAMADFSISYLECEALENIIMEGENVGDIVSLDGMKETVTIEVDKDIYNEYRKSNFQYVASFRPIVGMDEYYIDFYTNCDYYIDSIFFKANEAVSLNYSDLRNSKIDGVNPAVDTLAYIKNNRELGTNGAKDNSAFRGWYYDSTFTDECIFTENGTLEFKKNTSLYAKWIDEYTGTLDWGTYRPIDGKNQIYWTDEDVVNFPVVADRLGYSAGIRWYVDGENTARANSQSVSKSVRLLGKWVLDKPEIDIAPNFLGDSLQYQEDYDGDAVRFTYDEANSISLTAEYTHPIENLEYKNQKTGFSFEWRRVNTGALCGENTKLLGIQNVAEGDVYKLIVKVHSPYGETSTEETDIQVTIDRKPIDLGTVAFNNENRTYDSLKQTVAYTGQPVTSGLSVTYKYYDENGTPVSENGVTNAGAYTVVAHFEKHNAADAANYQAKELDMDFRIYPQELTFGGWSGTTSDWVNDTVVYNGTLRQIKMQIGGVLGSDRVDILYSNNEALNAGEYVALATGVSNQNYTLDGIEQTNLRFPWKIEKREVTVQTWQKDNSTWSGSSVIYDGKSHSVYAVLDGKVAGDAVDFSYSTETQYVNSATNAGHYEAKIVGVNNPNYCIAAGQALEYEWAITQRELSVSFYDPNLTYNGELQAITAIVTGFADGDVEEFTDVNDFVTTNSTANIAFGTTSTLNKSLTLTFSAKNAGSYKASIESLAMTSDVLLNNYCLTAAEKTFIIQPKSINVSADPYTYTYSGREQNLTLTISGILSADRESFNLSNFTTGATAGNVIANGYQLVYKAVDAGSYPVSVSAFNGNSNYKLANTYSGTITINKAVLTITSWSMMDEERADSVTIANGKMVTYNYAGYTVTPVFTGIQNSETVNLVLSGSTQTQKGDYTTSAALASSYSNYTLAPTNTTISWTIQPYVLNFTWKVEGISKTSFTYDGTAKNVQPVFETLGNDEVTLTYAQSNLTAKDVGSYNVQLNGTGNENYILGSGATFTWEITPRTVTVAWNVASSYVYTGVAQGPTIVLDGLISSDVANGKIALRYDLTSKSNVTGTSQSSYHSIIDENYTLSFADSALGFAVDAGTYTINISGIGLETSSSVFSTNANYVVASQQTFTIAKKSIDLSGVWKYTDGSTTLKYINSLELVYNKTGFTLTTTIADGAIVSGDNVTLSYANNQNTQAGSYTAVVSGLSGIHSGNYQLDTTVEKSNMPWMIAPKKVVLEWAEQSRTYTATVQRQEATFETGAASADDGKVYTGDTLNLIYNGNTATDAGTYTAKVVGLENNNYVIDEDTNCGFVWNINQVPVTIQWDTTSFIYNGEIQYPKAYFTFVGTRYDIEDYTDFNNVNCGTYTVKVGGLGNNNFDITHADTKNLTKEYTIGQRELAYTWIVKETNKDISGASFSYDGNMYTAIVNMTNICDGDNVTLTYSNNEFKDAGNYTASITGINSTNDNYKLKSSNSISFAVQPKIIGFAWTGNGNFTFDGTLRTMTATPIDVLAGDVVNVKEYSGNRSGTNSGTYTVTVTALDNPNYAIKDSEKTETITIAKQTVVVRWNGENTVTYDGGEHSLDANVIGKENNQDVAVAFHYDAVKTSNYGSITSSANFAISAGVYNISVVLDNPNYQLADTAQSEKTLTINKLGVSFIWSDSTVEYDGETHTITAEIKNRLESDSITLTYSGTAYKNAGTYEIEIMSLDNSNYEIAMGAKTTVTLTITKKVLTFVWTDTSNTTYNGTVQAPTVTTINGIVGGDSVNVAYTDGSSDFKSAGVHTRKVASLSGLNSSNYTFDPTEVSASQTRTINPKIVTFTWSGDTNCVYDGYVHIPTATINGLISGDSVGIVYEALSSNFIDAGTHVRKISALNGSTSDNYTFVDDATTFATIVIAKQTVSVSWNGIVADGNSPITYTGSSWDMQAGITGTIQGEMVQLPFIYLNTNTNERYDSSPTYTNTGTYIVKIEKLTGVYTNNFTLDGVGEELLVRTLTINPKQVSIDETTLPRDTVYDANTYTVHLGINGLINNENISIKVQSVEQLAGNGSIQTIDGVVYVKGAGTYKIVTSNELLGNNANNYTIASEEISFTIAKQSVSIAWSGEGEHMISESETHTLTATIYGNGTVLGKVTRSYSEAGEYTLTLTETEFNLAIGEENLNNYTWENVTGETSNSCTITVESSASLA